MMDIGKMVTRLIEAGCDPVVAARTVCDAFEHGRGSINTQKPASDTAPAIATFAAPDEIQKAACEHFGITPLDLSRRCRERSAVRRRWIVMRLYRDLTPMSYPEIARKFGIDHTTVMYGDRMAASLMAKNSMYRADFDAIRSRLCNGAIPPH